MRDLIRPDLMGSVMKSPLIFSFAVLGGWSISTSAHHSVAAVYDMDRLVTVEGIVSDVQLINPHGVIAIDVVSDRGSSQTWRVEMPGKLSLARRGWTDDTVAIGDRLVIAGNPARSEAPELFWKTITLEDGSKLVAPGEEDAQSIEELRRQRIREAQAQ